MNHPAIARLSPVQREEARKPTASDTPPPCRMTIALENIASTIIPGAAGLLMAANASSNMGVTIGAACAGSGVAGVLGMLLSEAIPEYAIPRLTGLKRLAANWLCGLCSIPFASALHRSYFPDEELGMVAGGLAAAASLLGVCILFIVLPMALRMAKAKAGAVEGAAPAPLPPALERTQYPKPADTVRLAPPGKPPKP